MGNLSINLSRDTIEQQALRNNYLQLVHMRGMAFYGHVATILIAYYGLNLVMPIKLMFGVVALLVGFNLFSFWRYRSGQTLSEIELFLGLMVDVFGLTALLYLSGGTSNPFISLYMIPVIISAVLVRKPYVWTILITTLICYGIMSIKRQHFTHAPMQATGGWFDIHVHGMMIAYALSALTLVYFVTKITANLRLRDIQIEALSRQIQDEAHMAQIGLMSAGAAHELGTPLTTISVILKDWLELGVPKKKTDIKGELDILMTQVTRCKAIVSDILSQGGQTRGEGARAQGLHDFVDGALKAWQLDHETPPDVSLDFVGLDCLIVGEKVLGQALYNLLQNAHEANQRAGRAGLGLKISVNSADVSFAVSDQGLGFGPPQLQSIGETHLGAKEADGHGLGLFLVKNVARRLGGGLGANNNQPYGATVTLTIPLKNLGAS